MAQDGKQSHGHRRRQIGHTHRVQPETILPVKQPTDEERGDLVFNLGRNPEAFRTGVQTWLNRNIATINALVVQAQKDASAEADPRRKKEIEAQVKNANRLQLFTKATELVEPDLTKHDPDDFRRVSLYGATLIKGKIANTEMVDALVNAGANLYDCSVSEQQDRVTRNGKNPVAIVQQRTPYEDGNGYDRVAERSNGAGRPFVDQLVDRTNVIPRTVGSTATPQPTPVDLPNDLKGKTDFFPEASWRNALVEHLQSGRVAQVRNQLNKWRRNGDHSKQCLHLLCAGESQHTIQDINFGLFTPQDFECVSLRGITFRRSVFPEGGEAFKESLEARGASFAGYRIGQQNYVPSTATAPAPRGRSPAR